MKVNDLIFWCNVKGTWRHVYRSHAIPSVMIPHVFKQLLSRYATTWYRDHIYHKSH